MISIGTIVLTVKDLERAGDFWREALGYVNRRAPTDDWVILDPPDGESGASIALSVTGYAIQHPPPIHLDLYASDQAVEVERLVGLGAKLLDWFEPPPESDYLVLEDTEGNRFCVVDDPGWDPATRSYQD